MRVETSNTILRACGKLSLIAAAASCACALSAAELPVPVSSEVGTGFWMENFAAATNLAHATSAPLVLFCSRGTTRISGSLSCGTREARSACARRGGAHHCSLVQRGDKGLKTL